MSKKLPPAQRRARLVPRNNEGYEVVRTGHSKRGLGDWYVKLLAASWRRLFVVIVALYLILNLLFASAYCWLGASIENARPGSFADAFFFSVQTLATIGYGKMAPVGLAANLLVTAEALTGFAFFAIITGMVFSKFSRPTARVLFSEVAVITDYEGVPHLMLRLANERNNRIVNAEVQMVLLRQEKTREGHSMRRFHDLTPVRARVPILQLTWSVLHKIESDSPLFNLKSAELRDLEAEIIVSITGLDETLSQTIHARYSYIVDEVLFGAVFEDILNRTTEGRLEVNYERFHQVRYTDTPACRREVALCEHGAEA